MISPLRIFKRNKPSKATVSLDQRSLYALAAVLFLSQLPHLMHLPLWVSLIGMSVVLLKLLHHHKPAKFLAFVLSPVGAIIIAIGSGLLIRAHYGYFIGRDPCVAFLFILVSCKFAEVRKPSDSTMLLCLAGFLLITQYFYSQSILSALITLPAVLAIGNALAVIRDSENAETTKNNLKMVGKLLLQGLPLAAFLFVVFPRLPGPLWSLPNDAVAKTGLSDSMSPGTIGNLSRSGEVAFRVEFDSVPPAPNKLYWRGPVLADYDGRKWSLGESNPKVTPYAGSVTNSNSASYTVLMQPSNHRWLFALDNPSSLPMPVSGDNTARPLATLSSDLQLKAPKPITQALRYKQTSSLRSSYTAVNLPGGRNTALAGNNEKTVKFARQLRSKSGSDKAFANAVLNYFNEEAFHYTLQPTLLGDSPVDEFLFSTRNGFCEHYASAFVILMRAAGIPSRVVTGYLGGEMNGDYMIVRQSDAHAWAEALLDGQWVRFDPTGAVAPSRVNTNMAAALGDNEPVPMMARQTGEWLKRFKLGIDELNYDWQRLVVDFNNDTQAKIWEKMGLPKLALWQITALVSFVIGLWCLALLGFPLLARSKLSKTEKLWEHYIAILKRYGINRETSETPNELVSRVALQLPENSHLTTIGTNLIRLRFAKLDTLAAAELSKQLNVSLSKQYLQSLFKGRPSTGTNQSSKQLAS